MSIFAGKTLMITGGTGSFGNAVLNRFLSTDIAEIRIFSRDEKKQDDMRHDYQLNYPDVAHKIKFYIGDVRNLESCRSAMPGTDYIFHAAALKQVPSCEFFPWEISYSLKEVDRADRVSKTNALLAVVLPDPAGSCEYVITKKQCCGSGCTFFNRTNLFTIIQENTFNRKRPPVHNCDQNDTIWEWPFSFIHMVTWNDFIADIDGCIDSAISIRERIGEFEIHKDVK